VEIKKQPFGKNKRFEKKKKKRRNKKTGKA